MWFTHRFLRVFCGAPTKNNSPIFFAAHVRFFSSNKTRNGAFYEATAKKGLLKGKLLTCAGLTSSPDVKKVAEILNKKLPLQPALRIFEVGAGWGRVPEALRKYLRRHPSFYYCGVEANMRFYDEACARFQKDPYIIFKHEDILRYPFAASEFYDAFLLLWCMIYEFTPEERERLMCQLYERIAPGGCILCDFPPENIEFSNITSQTGECVSIEMEEGVPPWHGEAVSVEKFTQFAEKTLPGVQVQVHPYLTDKKIKDQERRLCALWQTASSAGRIFSATADVSRCTL